MVNALFLENWTVTDYEQDDETLTITARYDLDPPSCPKCGVVGAKFYRHGPAMVEYVEAPAYGLRCMLKVETKRLKCLECTKTFMQPLPDMADGYMLTKRAVRYIERRTGNQTWAEMSRDLGIDEKTVRQVANDLIAKVNRRYQPYAPRILGIDELTLDGKLRVMLTDIDRGQPIDILEAYRVKLVIQWLSFLPDRNRIKMVAMDMSDNFRDAVRAVFPKVPIVADKFHVVRAASGALNSIRISMGRAAETKAAKKEAFRGRHMLLKRPKNLTAEQAFKLDGMLKNNPDLNAAYEAKEAFYRIWDVKKREDAEQAIDAWLASVPPQYEEAFKHAIRALKEWREEVLAFWGDATAMSAVTNAYTENANGMAKINNRKGRGYGFEVIRARVLLDLRKVNPEELTRCDRCGVGFASGMLVGQEPVTVGRGRKKRSVTLCPQCWVSQNVDRNATAHVSTLQSG